MLTVCSFAFYMGLFNYMKNTTKKSRTYAAYVNSSVNALFIAFTDELNFEVRLAILNGYIISDCLYLCTSKKIKTKIYLTFITHHLITLGLTTSSLVYSYPYFTKQLLIVERTVPISNVIWFINYYAKKNMFTINKLINITLHLIYVIFYTRYRVVNIMMLLYRSYFLSIPFIGYFLLISLYSVILLWYNKIIRKTISICK